MRYNKGHIKRKVLAIKLRIKILEDLKLPKLTLFSRNYKKRNIM